MLCVKHGAVPISNKKIIKNGENDVLCRFNYRYSCWNYGRSYNMVYFRSYARLKFSVNEYGANLEIYSVGRLVTGIYSVATSCTNRG